MANRLQKMLFNLSTLSPLVLIFSIVYWVEEEVTIFSKEANKLQFDTTSIVLIVIIIASVAFSFYDSFFIKLCRKKMESIPTAIDNITPNDNWVAAVLVSYALPATGIVFKNTNLYLVSVIIAIGLFLLMLSNIILPNPLLMLQKHHFYKITTVDGSSDIYLLSKRKCIHNRKIVDKVVIAFNYLAIEEDDANV